jgi:hypothetical protein
LLANQKRNHGPFIESERLAWHSSFYLTWRLGGRKSGLARLAGRRAVSDRGPRAGNGSAINRRSCINRFVATTCMYKRK